MRAYDTCDAMKRTDWEVQAATLKKAIPVAGIHIAPQLQAALITDLYSFQSAKDLILEILLV